MRTPHRTTRISPDVLALVRRVAELKGCTVSDFLVVAAREAACRTIEDAQIIRLSVEDQKRFAQALLEPPAPSPALERAAHAHARLIDRAA